MSFYHYLLINNNFYEQIKRKNQSIERKYLGIFSFKKYLIIKNNLISSWSHFCRLSNSISLESAILYHIRIVPKVKRRITKLKRKKKKKKRAWLIWKFKWLHIVTKKFWAQKQLILIISYLWNTNIRTSSAVTKL